MDLQGIREASRRRPFEPFSICLADGRRLHVPHPDFVSVGTNVGCAPHTIQRKVGTAHPTFLIIENKGGHL